VERSVSTIIRELVDVVTAVVMEELTLEVTMLPMAVMPIIMPMAMLTF
jgi:hypothetical protein